MNITSVKYFEGDGGVEAVINGITMCVPVTIENLQWQAILEWVAAGNTITPA
jgi:hypothetical protein